MKKENITLKSLEDYNLSLTLFEADSPKAVIQIVHGMEEHKERYFDFAEFLANNGYTVLVSDLRGHGSEAPKLSHIANKNGHKLLIEDQKAIRTYIDQRFPNLHVILFGHSMGTIISRVLLQTESKDYFKVVLSGYVNPNPASGVAVCLGNIVKTFKKKDGHSKLLTTLAMGPFAKSVKDRKTDLDWLSYNEENVQKYIEEYCAYGCKYFIIKKIDVE